MGINEFSAAIGEVLRFLMISSDNNSASNKAVIAALSISASRNNPQVLTGGYESD